MINKTELRHSIPVMLALVVGTLIIYTQTLDFTFLNFDDETYVAHNAVIQRGLTAGGIAWAFSHGLVGNWHPVTCLSHMLDCELFGLAPGGHHAVNVAFHIANAILLFLWLRQLLVPYWSAAFVAALFAWHPLRVESVAWVSERKDVLSLFFALLAFRYYTKYAQGVAPVEFPPGPGPGRRAYLAALGWFFLGLLSKPMLVTVPLLLVLMDYWPLQRIQEPADGTAAATSRPTWPQIQVVLIEKWPFLCLSLAACFVTFFVQRDSGAMEYGEAVGFPARLANAGISYVRYLYKTVWPVDLAALYPYPGHWPSLLVMGAVVLLAGLSLAALVVRKSQPWLAVGWFWFVGALVPVIGLIQVGRQAMADRYTYLPHIGLLLAATTAGARLLEGWRQPLIRWVAAGLAGGILAAALAASWQQTRCWHDTVSLFTHAVAITSDNTVAEYNLAQGLQTTGQWEPARAHYRAALRIKPDYFAALVNLGVLEYNQGNFNEATNLLAQAVRLRPAASIAHTHLAVALGGTGDCLGVRRELDRAGSLGATNQDLLLGLARMLEDMGRTGEANLFYEKSLERDPDNITLLNNVAWALATASRPELRDGRAAVRHATHACELTRFEVAQLIGTLAAAYAEAGEFEAAIRSSQQAIALAERQTDQELAQKNRELLLCFQAGRPWREK